MSEQSENIKQDAAMTSSLANIQLTPEAKRLIEGEIAWQTSGNGFWLIVGLFYVVGGLFLAGILAVIAVGLAGAILNGVTSSYMVLFLLIPALLPVCLILQANRMVKLRRG